MQGGAVGQGVGVGAVGPQGQRTPCSGPIGLGHEGDGIADVGVIGSGQQDGEGVGRACRLLADGGRRGAHGGRVVGAVDGEGQSAGGGAAVPVRDGIGEGVGHGFARPQPLHGGGAVVQDIYIGAVGVEGQGTVQARRGRLGHEGHDVVDVRIGHGPQRTQGYGLDVFGEACGLHRGHGQIVGAADVHGERADRDAAVLILDRIVEGFGQALVLPECLHYGQAVVQRIRVGPGGVEGQGAVQPRLGHLGRIGQHIGARSVQGIVRIRRGQPARGREHGAFLDRASAGRGRGGVVGALDGDGQGVVAHRAVAVFHGVQEHFGQRVAHADDSLAQLVEHNTFNVGVLGSSPRRITKKGYSAMKTLFLYLVNCRL